MLKIGRYLLYLIGLVLLYLVAVILFAQFTYYSPKEIENLSQSTKAETLTADTLSILNWNIGFAGLGAESDFFYDGGKQTRSTKEQHLSYWSGIQDFLSSQSTDFITLQEVDVNSKRSYGTNEKEKLSTLRKYADFAYNYKVKFVPKPFNKPLGRVNSGLLSLSNSTPAMSDRIQFPGSYAWPTKLFFLRRCMLVQRFPIKNNKELLIINAHFSAYDDGDMKAQEMDALKQFLQAEHEKGNSIVVAADWNIESDDQRIKEFLPSWRFAIDDATPTNRSLDAPFSEQSETKVIDFFLVSPSVKVLETKTIDLKFSDSDHQPVRLDFSVKLE